MNKLHDFTHVSHRFMFFVTNDLGNGKKKPRLKQTGLFNNAFKIIR